MRTTIVYILCFICLNAFSQSVSEIKADENYIYGEGWGMSLKQADNQALQDLTSKISVNVRSSFSSTIKEINKNGDIDSSRDFESLIQTYSQSTLTNTQRIVLSNEPEAQVVRYIKVEEVKRIFEGRKAKVIDMVESAGRAEQRGKVDDALRYLLLGIVLAEKPSILK